MGESHFCPGNSKYFLTFHKMLGFAVTVFDDQLQQELFVLHCATSVLDKMASWTTHYLTAMHNIRDITYKRCRTVCCSRSCVRFRTVCVAEPVAPLLFHAHPRWPLQSPGAIAIDHDGKLWILSTKEESTNMQWLVTKIHGQWELQSGKKRTMMIA